ncbi:hypothetical protein [Gilliamella sp. BG7]|uniref:hypothetical protein n=1 Tax=unclassified Gilliamella TaxID=2685620 RepID=UPI003987A0BE
MIVKSIKYGIALILAYFIIANISIYISSLQKTIKNADTVVVLGSQVINTPAIAPPTLA